MMLSTQKLTAIAAIAYVLTTAGCSSAPTSKSIVKEQLHIEKQRREVAQQQAEKTIDAMPSWVANVPRPDGTGVYALGIAESDKVQIALKKAQLQAEYGLAKLYNQELSGSEQAMQQDAGASSSSNYQSLIQSLVNYVSVVGFEVVKQDVKAVNGEFQAYIRIKGAMSSANSSTYDSTTRTGSFICAMAYSKRPCVGTELSQLLLRKLRVDALQQPMVLKGTVVAF